MATRTARLQNRKYSTSVHDKLNLYIVVHVWICIVQVHKAKETRQIEALKAESYMYMYMYIVYMYTCASSMGVCTDYPMYAYIYMFTYMYMYILLSELCS